MLLKSIKIFSITKWVPSLLSAMVRIMAPERATMQRTTARNSKRHCGAATLCRLASSQPVARRRNRREHNCVATTRCQTSGSPTGPPPVLKSRRVKDTPVKDSLQEDPPQEDKEWYKHDDEQSHTHIDPVHFSQIKLLKSLKTFFPSQNRYPHSYPQW